MPVRGGYQGIVVLSRSTGDSCRGVCYPLVRGTPLIDRATIHLRNQIFSVCIKLPNTSRQGKTSNRRSWSTKRSQSPSTNTPAKVKIRNITAHIDLIDRISRSLVRYRRRSCFRRNDGVRATINDRLYLKLVVQASVGYATRVTRNSRNGHKVPILGTMAAVMRNGDCSASRSRAKSDQTNLVSYWSYVIPNTTSEQVQFSIRSYRNVWHTRETCPRKYIRSHSNKVRIQLGKVGPATYLFRQAITETNIVRVDVATFRTILGVLLIDPWFEE